MVDIRPGGSSLFMECRGSGSPTVIFLAGHQVPRGAMRGVEDALLDEGSVRVCDYDRAGEGRSDPTADPQTDLDVVDDLATLLEAADIAAALRAGGPFARWRPDVALRRSSSPGRGGLHVHERRSASSSIGTRCTTCGHRLRSTRSVHFLRVHLGSVKQAATPPDGMPYVVMMSTVAQCASRTDVCGRIYPFYEAWAQELADRTGSGRMVSVEAGHEIYQTQLDQVVRGDRVSA